MNQKNYKNIIKVFLTIFVVGFSMFAFIFNAFIEKPTTFNISKTVTIMNNYSFNNNDNAEQILKEAVENHDLFQKINSLNTPSQFNSESNSKTVKATESWLENVPKQVTEWVEKKVKVAYKVHHPSQNQTHYIPNPNGSYPIMIKTIKTIPAWDETKYKWVKRKVKISKTIMQISRKSQEISFKTNEISINHIYVPENLRHNLQRKNVEEIVNKEIKKIHNVINTTWKIVIKDKKQQLQLSVKVNADKKIHDKNYTNRTLVLTFDVFRYYSLNYLFKPSLQSDAYWYHTNEGNVKYWSSPPKTRVVVSENFIRALIEWSKRKILLDKLNNDSWGFIAQDKEIIIEAIKNFRITSNNYQNYKQIYLNTKSLDFLEKVKKDTVAIKIGISNKWDNRNWNSDLFNAYIRIIKSSKYRFNVQYKGIVNSSKKLDISKNKKYYFSDFGKLNAINFELTRGDINEFKHDNPNVIIPNKIESYVSSLTNQPKNDNYNFIQQTNILFDNSGFKDSKKLYNLDVKVSNSQKDFSHMFLYQVDPLNISNDVSFQLADGRFMNQNYELLPIVDAKHPKYGYKVVQYESTLNNGAKENILLQEKNGKWWSSKYHEFIEKVDKNFDKRKIIYVFNQEIQMMINPYHVAKVTPNSKPLYGIAKVTDLYNGTPEVLEDWTDGKWSHTTDLDGKAKFDGIFGVDMNGFKDPNGRLKDGKHNISIELFKRNSKITSNFNIIIDTTPTNFKIKSNGRAVHQTELTEKDGTGHILNYPFYYSSGPITVEVKNKDVSNVNAEFLDSSGRWYSLPVRIINKQINGVWKRVVSTTMDYVGFARITFSDDVNNTNTIFLRTMQSETELLPNIAIHNDVEQELPLNHINPKKILVESKWDKQLKTIDKKYSLIRFADINTLKSKPIIILDPLVKEMEINKVEISNEHIYNREKANSNSYEVLPYKMTIPNKDYNFGKTLFGSSSSPLKFLGDELKPYIKNDKSTSNPWSMEKSSLKFNKFGLYEIVLKTNVVDKPLIKTYIYVYDKDNSAIKDFLNMKSTDAIDNLKTNGTMKVAIDDKDVLLKESKKIVHKDVNVDIDTSFVMKTMGINLPEMLISKVRMWGSVIWYSSFDEIDPTSPYDANGIMDEGKYKVEVTDIFGNIYKKEILVIHPEKDRGNGWNHIFPEKLKVTDKKEILKQAFWSGDMTWNFWRYEDKNHVTWEKDKFIKEAIKKGLSKKEAEAKYKDFKLNKFNGTNLHWKSPKSLNKGPNKDGEFVRDAQGKKHWKSFSIVPSNNQSRFQPKEFKWKFESDWKKQPDKKKNIGMYVGVGVGTTIFVISLFAIFFLYNRKKTKKIT